MRRQGGLPNAGLIALAVLALVAASYVAVPMRPVPLTLQTLAVALVGAWLGPWPGALAVLAWLALGAAGLPVLASGSGGWAKFMGPTGGYLFAFPVAAALVGMLDRRGWSRAIASAIAAMLLAHAACLLGGAAWLALRMGARAALLTGIVPFLPGAAIKSLVGAALLRLSRAR